MLPSTEIPRSPRSKPDPMEDSSVRILAAATRHFAEFGYDDTSVRNIAAEAGVNPALINYYFRSKDDLYREVVSHSVQRLAEARIETLDHLEREAGGAPIPIKTLLAATAGPIFAESRVPGTDRRAYIKFLSRLFTDPGPHTVDVLFGGLKDLRSRLFEALRRSLPHVPKRELAWRYLFLSGSVHFTAAQVGYVEVISGGECDSQDMDTALAHFIAAQAAMLSAPPTGAAERRLARKFAKAPPLVATMQSASPRSGRRVTPPS